MPDTRSSRARSSSPSGSGVGEPTSATRHLSVIRRGVASDRAVAELLDVAPSQLTRWRRGQTPDPLNADRLAALALVVEMLLRWLPDALVEDWLHGPNEHLDGRTPARVLGIGQIADVIGAVEAMKAGVFA